MKNNTHLDLGRKRQMLECTPATALFFLFSFFFCFACGLCSVCSQTILTFKKLFRIIIIGFSFRKEGRNTEFEKSNLSQGSYMTFFGKIVMSPKGSTSGKDLLASRGFSSFINHKL